MLDELEDVLAAGWPVPGVGRAMVDVDKATDLIEAIREQFPQELQTARQMTSDRERLLDEANAEAQHVVEQAHRQAADLVKQEGIYKTAERQARTLLEQAQARSEETRAKADEYAVDSLRALETQLTRTLATVQNGIASLQARNEHPAHDD